MKLWHGLTHNDLKYSPTKQDNRFFFNVQGIRKTHKIHHENHKNWKIDFIAGG